MGRFYRRRRVAAPAPETRGVWQVPARFNFTRDVVEARAATDPNRIALTSVDHAGIIDRRTFKEVADDASRWAALLRSRGLVPGDRLLVVVGSTPAWPAVLLGALKAGLVAVPCPVQSEPRDLAFRVKHSGAGLVVVDRERQPDVRSMRVPVTEVVVEDVRAELRELEAVQPTHDTAADDVAFILYTSGTTSDPKGATHTHGYTWAQRLQAEHWLGVRPGDRVWCTAGTGSAKAIWNVLLGPWACGAESVMYEGDFEAEQRFYLLERLGVTVLCQPPTEYRLMAKLPLLETYNLDRLRHAASSGDRLDPGTIDAFRETFGLTVCDGYGQTENTVLVANAPGADVRPGSMGLPTPGHDVAVIDDEENELPAGSEGQIALRGRPPSLFRGYWNAPDETRAAFLGEWYVTGDRALRDEDGYFWFTGRVDDVVLDATHHLGPFDIENALLEHPAVVGSAVVGNPDANGDALVKALVVLRPGAEPSDELVLALHDRVTAVMAPSVVAREIEFVPGLPKTPTGKVRRVELREQRTDRTVTKDTPTVAPAEDAEPVVPQPEAAQQSEELRRAEDEERRRKQEAEAEAAEEQQRKQEAEATEEATRRAEAEAQQAAAATAYEEERQRKQDEKAAAEAARRAEAEARKSEAQAQQAAAAKAREDERQRKQDEKAAAEAARRAEADARDAERRADQDRRAADAERRAEEKRAHKEAKRRGRADSAEGAVSAAPGGRATEEEHGPEDRSNQELLARLSAYSHHDDAEDREPPAE